MTCHFCDAFLWQAFDLSGLKCCARCFHEVLDAVGELASQENGKRLPDVNKNINKRKSFYNG